MRKSSRWATAAFLCLAIVGSARQALAQEPAKVELSGGYNWLTAKPSVDNEWTQFPKGWYVDVAGALTDTMSVVGQVTGNRKTFDDQLDFKIHTFMGGARATWPGRFRPFGQLLAGAARFSASAKGFDDFSETDFAVQIGGGVNVFLHRNVGVRAGADYLRIFAKDDGLTIGGADVNGIRVNLGIVLGFGKR